MSKTRQEWIDEQIAMKHQPNPDTPEKRARAMEMTERYYEIEAFLHNGGPEPGPWNPKHPATPEEKKQDEAEYIARTTKRWGISADD